MEYPATQPQLCEQAAGSEQSQHHVHNNCEAAVVTSRHQRAYVLRAADAHTPTASTTQPVRHGVYYLHARRKTVRAKRVRILFRLPQIALLPRVAVIRARFKDERVPRRTMVARVHIGQERIQRSRGRCHVAYLKRDVPGAGRAPRRTGGTDGCPSALPAQSACLATPLPASWQERHWPWQ